MNVIIKWYNMMEDPIKEIYKVYPEFETDTELVFKSCQIEWIVVLAKLPDTITNENRDDVFDARFAMFRANKLRVVKIFNKMDYKRTIDTITNSVYHNICVYKVGEIVESDAFDSNINTVCGSGIHYFTNVEAALYYERYSIINGKFKHWYDSGRIFSESTYKNGKMNGQYTIWYENGQKKVSCEYLDNKKHNKYTKWYVDGQIMKEMKYRDGKKVGSSCIWIKSRNRYIKCIYKNCRFIDEIYYSVI